MYEYNETIKIKSDAPTEFYPNSFGVVISSFEVSNEEDMKKYNVSEGTTIYIIELSDSGLDITVPEFYTEKV
ncbi:MAG: hypothetical protein SNJ55_13405 [Chloroherpetonaceae bacterium]